jgi:hypothetical protein
MPPIATKALLTSDDDPALDAPIDFRAILVEEGIDAAIMAAACCPDLLVRVVTQICLLLAKATGDADGIKEAQEMIDSAATEAWGESIPRAPEEGVSLAHGGVKALRMCYPGFNFNPTFMIALLETEAAYERYLEAQKG